MILSVALCTYNGEKYIREQIDSIINQSHKVDEIIICDDFSTDSTNQILKEYAYKYPALISIYENKSNLRTLKNFEKSISLTSGDLIFLSDQDDIWKENKVEVIVNYFKNIKEFKLLFTNGDLINEEGNELNSTLWDEWGFTNDMRKLWVKNEKAYKDLVVNKNKITGATVCFNKSIKKKAIPILTPPGFWHDAWLGIHAAAEDGLCFLEESLIFYRVHEKQQVGVSKNFKVKDKKGSLSNINKKEFYSILRNLYPRKKYLLPEFKKKSFIRIFLNKFKK